MLQIAIYTDQLLVDLDSSLLPQGYGKESLLKSKPHPIVALKKITSYSFLTASNTKISIFIELLYYLLSIISM